MKKLYFGISIFFIGIFVSINKSYAQIKQATCSCDVQCTFADGSTYSQSNSWTKHSGKKKYGGIIGNKQKTACQTQCSTFASGINGEGLAAEKKACGPWKCIPTAKITRKSGKVGWGPEIQPQATGNFSDPNICSTDQTNERDPIYSYASKVLCGLSKPLNLGGNTGPLGIDRAVPGVYGTAVNVHNPHFEDVFFRWKVAPAGPNKDLGHSAYFDETVKPDNARYFDCPILSEKPDLFDGFMVIESDKPLDVTTYYSATKIDLSKPDKQLETVPAIDVETTKEREITPPKNWGCQKNVRRKLNSVANWTLQDGSPALAAGGGSMSYAIDGGQDGSLLPGDYIFDYKFCLCEDGEAEISVPKLETDDGVKVEWFPNPGFILHYPLASYSGHPGTPQNFTATSSDSGQNILRLTINQISPGNVGNGMRATVNGSILIQNGYLGQCMARHR